MADTIDTQDLELDRIIGFNGEVPGGLIVHPDRDHLIYSLGCNIIIESLNKDSEQCILTGHTNNVTCIAVSNDGSYIVSGQVTYMGFQADIKLWSYATKKVIHTWSLHKVKVQSLAFSRNDKYVISLGGQDDGSVVVWDMATGEPICGSPAQVASAGITTCLATSKLNDDVFVTGGEDTLRIWHLDKANRKIRPSNTNIGGLKRIIYCIEMVDYPDSSDQYFFCGTSTGDILCINMKSNILQFHVPQKNNFSSGVSALSFVKFTSKGFNMLIGTGEGVVGNYDISVTFERGNHAKTSFKHRSDAEPWNQNGKVMSITSISKRGQGHQFFVGTGTSQVYKFQFADFSAELVKTCHSSRVNDVIFPFGEHKIIITCQNEEIRVWNLTNGLEIRRYVNRNLNCNALAISRDGKDIISGWDDGKIRILGIGKDNALVLKHEVKDAHNKGVTAVAVTSLGDRIISGGGEGMVRVWNLIKGSEVSTKLKDSMKEHKNTVSEIVMHSNDKECASAGGDGTTIIWDLVNAIRKKVVFANTLFKSVRYGQDELQIITCGTDRKIAYWDTYNATMIRDLDGAKAGSINSMDVTADWKFFATGGEEKLLKLWLYSEGEVTHVGKGHSAPISRIRIAPSNNSIISVTDDGAILQWKFPDSL